jgi:hypothetical protein
MNHKLNSFLDSVPNEVRSNFIETAEIIKPVVDNIHGQPAMYQNYYGEYMLLISKLENAKPLGVKYWSIVCLIAGCNEIGIEAAMKNL